MPALIDEKCIKDDEGAGFRRPALAGFTWVFLECIPIYPWRLTTRTASTTYATAKGLPDLTYTSRLDEYPSILVLV
ncbi:hypothetical protein PQX77_021060, partial [Marasmius sp. AFHP31]